MKTRTRLFHLALVAGLLGCEPAAETADADTQATAPADVQADAEAIRSTVDRFLTAFNAADMQAAASIYTDDVVQLAPDGPVLEGRDATITAVEQFLAQFPTAPSQTATFDEVSVHGDIAFARGTWTVRQTPDGGAEQTRNGKWLTIHERQPDGSWKISRWVWNEEGASAPGPGAA